MLSVYPFLILFVFSDGYEIAVVYFRAGYEPGHYPSKKEWDARLLVEKYAFVSLSNANISSFLFL